MRRRPILDESGRGVRGGNLHPKELLGVAEREQHRHTPGAIRWK